MTIETASGLAAGVPEAPQLPVGLDTPALVIDLDIVERNAHRLGDALAARGIALRPHAKTHKSVALARLQLDAGARGITVGNLGEAEVFADGGIDDIFIAYPVLAEGAKVDRLRALHERAGLRLAVGFDSIEGARRLAAAVAGSSRSLRVVLELDPGNKRTGAPVERAGEVARAARDAGLDVLGVFTHGGHAYHPGGAEPGGADEVRTLAAGADALRAEGIEPSVISAGSTPTQLTAAVAPVNEIRAGTYIIGDRQQWAIGAVPSDGIAIAVAATCVSRAVHGQAVIDAGAKTLTKDVAGYIKGHGLMPAYPAAIIERVSDYHGVIRPGPDGRLPELGEVVAVIPNHVCPVIDLKDSFVATRSGAVIGTWPVDARGRSG
ncbi:MAG TPA: alanine racemase [Candidatus Limnocylindrales bacterium]|nr:alanine racemase [Candidatus Limnocylindrales bacterium]